MKLLTNKRSTRTLVLIAATALLGIVIVAVFLTKPATSSDPDNSQGASQMMRKVSVIDVKAGRQSALISGFAEAHPRWQSTLRANVDGTLIHVADTFQPGVEVHAGQVLATIDSIAWVANLAEARNRLATAEIALLREMEEAGEALRNWDTSGLDGDPDSPLVLHKPQIDAAQQEKTAALAACKWAARQLADTAIRAPFTGVIMERNISRGESVMGGDPIAVLVGTDAFELALPVPESQWLTLPDSLGILSADLSDPNSGGHWHAKVVRRGAALDPATRLHTLFLEVTQPLSQTPPLLPGTFVEVHLEGTSVNRVLALPEGTLSRTGHIWYVDDDQKLACFKADLLFTRAGQVYVTEPAPTSLWRIVQFPLESYFVGLRVQPETTPTLKPDTTLAKGH